MACVCYLNTPGTSLKRLHWRLPLFPLHICRCVALHVCILYSGPVYVDGKENYTLLHKHACINESTTLQDGLFSNSRARARDLELNSTCMLSLKLMRTCVSYSQTSQHEAWLSWTYAYVHVSWQNMLHDGIFVSDVQVRAFFMFFFNNKKSLPG